MAYGLKSGLCLAVALALVGGTAMAQPDHDKAPGGGGHPAAAPAGHPAGEPHPGPKGYARVTEPQGWNARPTTVDRGAYQHNYQAARTYHIGPYHPPSGWTGQRWAYGQILPRAFWASEYILADYWLFGLEVPPGGYEWVRDGDDALLINTDTGEILQVEYDVFA